MTQSAEARIPTDRAARYLEQLCSHLGAMQHMRHLPTGGHGGAGVPRVEDIEQTSDHAVVRFADGSWDLDAADDALVLRVTAHDDAALDRLKAAIAARIAKIGRRDGLSVVWSPPADTRDENVHTPPPPGAANRTAARPSRPGWWRRHG